jgi:hypothetical protein
MLCNELAFIGCGKAHALCQGTTLVGPYPTADEGFSPWGIAFLLGADFFKLFSR